MEFVLLDTFSIMFLMHDKILGHKNYSFLFFEIHEGNKESLNVTIFSPQSNVFISLYPVTLLKDHLGNDLPL